MLQSSGMGECFTWHRAILAGGYPPTIVAAAAFHNRVRDGSVWFHSAMDTRIDSLLPQVIPENCIGCFIIADQADLKKRF